MLPLVTKLELQHILSPNERTPEEQLTSNTPDISEYLDFGLYDCIWYWHVGDKAARVGHWLGVATTRGEFMSYWILPHSGQPIVCSTVQHVTKDEARDPKYREFLLSYDKQIDKTMNIKDKAVDLTGLKPWDLIDIDFPAQELSADVIPEADEFDVSTYDKYVGATRVKSSVELRMKWDISKATIIRTRLLTHLNIESSLQMAAWRNIL